MEFSQLVIGYPYDLQISPLDTIVTFECSYGSVKRLVQPMSSIRVPHVLQHYVLSSPSKHVRCLVTESVIGPPGCCAVRVGPFDSTSLHVPTLSLHAKG